MQSRERNRFTLDELLAGITDSNQHGEISWGRSCEDEAW